MASKQDRIMELAYHEFYEASHSNYTVAMLSESIGYISGLASSLRVMNLYPALLEQCEKWIKLLDDVRKNRASNLR